MNRAQTNLLLQHELLCCRVCLMLDCRLYNIHEYKLADTFARISGTPVSRDRLPQYLCAYCLVLLLKCSSFRDMCLRTLKRLTPTRCKRALDTDYIRKYQLPHRSLNLTQTEIEIIELLPSEDSHNEEVENIVSLDGINEAYPQIKPEMQEDLIEISDDDFENEIVFKDGIISKKKIEKTQTIENILKTEKTKGQTETPVEENMVLMIGHVFNESMDCDNNIMKIENTDSTEAPVEENMVLKIGHVYNESMNFDNNLMKMGKENTGTMKMMTIEVKDDKFEFKVGEKSDDDNDLCYEEVANVNISRKNVKERPNIIKSENVRRRRPRLNFATFESTYNLKIVTLSKEEQLEEIAARKKSEKYLVSQFKCEDCGKGFGVESAYKNHGARHSPSNGPHVCEICASYFMIRNRLHQHQNQHRLKFICNECKFVSRNRYLAIKHHEMHTGKTYDCEHCSKSYIKSGTYCSHMRQAHPELNVDCVDCGETFLTNYGLRRHKKWIHDVKSQKFICTICSIEFNSVEALYRHTDTAGEHKGLQPCEQCGENCASEDKLQEHVGEMHPTESHHCEVCNVAFSNAGALETHNRRQHLGPRNARLPGRRQYGTSLNKVEPCMCDQCGVIVRNLMIHKRRHLAVKPYACPHCPKTFVFQYFLTYHMRSHNGNKPYKCPECPLAFNLMGNFNRHYKVAHLGIRFSFPCPICGRTSTTKASMKVHVRAVHGDAGWPKRDRSKRKKKTQLDDQ